MQNAIAMFMNIHSRFIFENSFYEARQNGLLSEDEITELMLEAQKESYQDSLGTYHPHFWASKLHFFIDDVPFYNFLIPLAIYSAWEFTHMRINKEVILKINTLHCFEILPQ